MSLIFYCSPVCRWGYFYYHDLHAQGRLFPFFFLGDLQSNAIYIPTPWGSARTPFPDAPVHLAADLALQMGSSSGCYGFESVILYYVHRPISVSDLMTHVTYLLPFELPSLPWRGLFRESSIGDFSLNYSFLPSTVFFTIFVFRKPQCNSLLLTQLLDLQISYIWQIKAHLSKNIHQS